MVRGKKRLFLALLAVSVFLSLAIVKTAVANPVILGENQGGGVYTATLDTHPEFDGADWNAQATFSIDGDNLIIILENFDDLVSYPTEILTGLTFDIVGDPMLIAESAVILNYDSLTSIVNPYGVLPPEGGAFDGDVSPEWAYKEDLPHSPGANDWIIPGGAYYGVSATGQEDIFGADDIINPYMNLGEPNDSPPNGLSWGITGDTTLLPSINFHNLIYGQVEFTLSGLPGNITLDDISNVNFVYGTDATPATPIPEPATIVLLGSGLIGFVVNRKRKKS